MIPLHAAGSEAVPSGPVGSDVSEERVKGAREAPLIRCWQAGAAGVTICSSFTLLSVPVGKLLEMMEGKNKMSQQKGVSRKFKHFLTSHIPPESKLNQSTNEPTQC